MTRKSRFNRFWTIATLLTGAVIFLALSMPVKRVSSQGVKNGNTVKRQAIGRLLSTGGVAARQTILRRSAAGNAPRALAAIPGADDAEDPINEGLITEDDYLASDPGPDPAGGDGHGRPGNNGGPRNVFVNDPCLDPPPPSTRRTVQSETEIAVLNRVRGAGEDGQHGRNSDGDDESEGSDGSGKLMVAGYNDSYGFYNNLQGLSGFSYSTNGGKSWIDGGGLPPVVKSGLPAGTPGQDAYFGDPVVQVHHRSKIFYYASIYLLPDGTFTLSVNRGKFKVAPPQGIESKANTRCEGNPAKFGIPDPPATIRRRVIWEPPVVAVKVFDPGDFLDKEWLYVDQRTGELYLVYVRFGSDGSSPLELVRSFDGGHIWTTPSVIVPNLLDTFNTGLNIVTTPTGRVVVSWWSRTFNITIPAAPVVSERIESAYSDNDGVTFSPTITVASVNPQGEPRGYNRGRSEILNVTYMAVDKGKDDGASPGSNDEDSEDRECRNRSGYGNVYLTYFNGKTPLGQVTRAGDIKLSVSPNGATWRPQVKVNDDNTNTSHVFPSVQVNKWGTIFVTWVDRRLDPVNNILTDTWGAFSNNRGNSFASNFRITNVSTDWFVRADARPNFGDYNSSEVINFESFASIWADGRFPPGTFVPTTCNPQVTPCPPRRNATPDTLFAVVRNRGENNGDHDNGH
jgi:hypothetical protein